MITKEKQFILSMLDHCTVHRADPDACESCPFTVTDLPVPEDPCWIVFSHFLQDVLPGIPGPESEHYLAVVSRCLECSSGDCETCPCGAEFSPDHERDFFAEVYSFLKEHGVYEEKA